MRLLDLPNELLQEIFSYLSPRKIRKISYVCRGIYSLVHHLKMNDFFASVQVGSGSGYWGGIWRKPADVLSKFFNDPANRTYVKSLTFGGIEYDKCLTAAKDREVVTSVAWTRVVGSQASQRKHRTWMHTLQQKDSQDLSFAQLLSVLPNLGELKMCGMPGRRSRKMIKTLADNAIISGGLPPLPQLRKAAYTPPYQSHHSRASRKGIRLDIKFLAILTTFPSLQSLHISELSTHLDEFLMWPNGPCSFSVEKLHLENCGLGTTFFASLVGEFQNLRVFRYHAPRASVSYDSSSAPGWEPGALAKAFSANTKRLLETMDARGCWQWYTRDAFRCFSSANYNPVPPLLNHFIGPLQGFQALKYIFINYILLLDHGIPCPLIKTLPKSVETVALVSHMKWWKTSEPPEISMDIFLEGLPEEKMIILPHLKQIMLDEPDIVVQTPLRSRCEEVGVRITKYVWEQDSEW